MTMRGLSLAPGAAGLTAERAAGLAGERGREWVERWLRHAARAQHVPAQRPARGDAVARQGGTVGETPWEVAKLSGAPAQAAEKRAVGHPAARVLPLARCYLPPVRQVAVLGLAPAPQGGAQAA
jgi:hypothetical protein